MNRAPLCFCLAMLLLPGTVAGAPFTFRVPENHFLGISEPCPSVAKARQKALQDIVAQVLRTIGAEYTLNFSSHITGNNDHVKRRISERFHYSASGFLRRIDRRLVKESYEETPEGLVYKMLVHFTDRDIERARRLSLGAKLHARWIGSGMIEFREVNGVPVVLTEYQLRVDEQNRYAQFLSFFVMKVSAGSTRTIERALPEPVIVQHDAVRRINLKVPEKHTGLRELLLGTRQRVTLTFLGRDQVGRPIRVIVRAP